MTMESKKTKSKFRWLTTRSFTHRGEMIHEQVWTAFDRFMATSTRYVLASDEPKHSEHSKYVVLHPFGGCIGFDTRDALTREEAIAQIGPEAGEEYDEGRRHWAEGAAPRFEKNEEAWDWLLKPRPEA